MTEIEKVKAEIKVLEKKLSFLEELSQIKTPAEIAYKRVYGKYPVEEVSENLTAEDNWNVISWSAFQDGYKSAQKDYKVGEYQEPEPQKPKTLWERFYDAKWSDSACDEFCEIVENWISQYGCDYNDRYAEGYEDALKTLKDDLK